MSKKRRLKVGDRVQFFSPGETPKMGTVEATYIPISTPADTLEYPWTTDVRWLAMPIPKTSKK